MDGELREGGQWGGVLFHGDDVSLLGTPPEMLWIWCGTTLVSQRVSVGQAEIWEGFDCVLKAQVG